MWRTPNGKGEKLHSHWILLLRHSKMTPKVLWRTYAENCKKSKKDKQMQKYWEVIRTGVIFKVFRILLDQYNEYTSKLEKITFPSEFIAFETMWQMYKISVVDMHLQKPFRKRFRLIKKQRPKHQLSCSN